MAEEHSSRGIMIAVIVGAVILLAIVVPFTVWDDESAARSRRTDDVDSRIRPVARVEVLGKAGSPAPAAAAGGGQDTATIVNTVCGACHNTGAAGAPKTGDKAAWGPRIAQGNETLYKNAINGKGAMPPKGGAAQLSDADIKAAVDFLVAKAK